MYPRPAISRPPSPLFELQTFCWFTFPMIRLKDDFCEPSNSLYFQLNKLSLFSSSVSTLLTVKDKIQKKPQVNNARSLYPRSEEKGINFPKGLWKTRII